MRITSRVQSFPGQRLFAQIQVGFRGFEELLDRLLHRAGLAGSRNSLPGIGDPGVHGVEGDGWLGELDGDDQGNRPVGVFYHGGHLGLVGVGQGIEQGDGRLLVGVDRGLAVANPLAGRLGGLGAHRRQTQQQRQCGGPYRGECGYGRPFGDWGYGAAKEDGRSIGVICRINCGEKLDGDAGAGAVADATRQRGVSALVLFPQEKGSPISR